MATPMVSIAVSAAALVATALGVWFVDTRNDDEP